MEKGKRKGPILCFGCKWLGFCQEGLKRFTVRSPDDCDMLEGFGSDKQEKTKVA